MALGLFVVATTMTRSPSCSPTPSISVKSVATTLFSTSPPALSSLLGHSASTSSMITTHGLFSLAARKTSRSFASVSPWYADARLGPEMVSVEECVEDATARAKRVLPVPGGPYKSTPRGGLSPAWQAVRAPCAVGKQAEGTKMVKQVRARQRYLDEIPDFSDLEVQASY